MTRQQWGYWLTVISAVALLLSYATAVWFFRSESPMQMILGASMTLLPLLLYTPRAIIKQPRAFAALALLAPIYLFFGGVVWIWGRALFGAWLCLWALILEIGAILHNFQKRRHKK
ncbi:ABC transporter [Suttonella sp. R2A3]|uniref:ABC transporter n=1 Tax=Suttonella sp. R2A3 TaxID=2908648 RepID=UPI001F2F09A7|nr:ABC transporter [Suttonella sp. R2A3]UJF24765.1 ABC transporter [Suttonella sp. R2A3]